MTVRIIEYEDETKVVIEQNDDIKVFTVGIQGPPGAASSGGWSFNQEATPAGTDGQTWFQPSTGYAHVYLDVTGGWERMILENMTADNNDHGLDANGGYF